MAFLQPIHSQQHLLLLLAHQQNLVALAAAEAEAQAAEEARAGHRFVRTGPVFCFNQFPVANFKDKFR